MWCKLGASPTFGICWVQVAVECRHIPEYLQKDIVSISVWHVTYRICCLSKFGLYVTLLLPAGSAAGSSAGIAFTHGPIFYGPLLPAKFHLDRLRGGVYGPPNLKKLGFYQYNCTIFTKFTGPMRVLSRYNFAKFGCFISINDKIINNLLRWGRFQPNFRRPLSAKLWTGPKNVLDLEWWHGPPLSPCKIWWKSRDARRRERMKCDVFHFVCLFLLSRFSILLLTRNIDIVILSVCLSVCPWHAGIVWKRLNVSS